MARCLMRAAGSLGMGCAAAWAVARRRCCWRCSGCCRSPAGKLSSTATGHPSALNLASFTHQIGLWRLAEVCLVNRVWRKYWQLNSNLLIQANCTRCVFFLQNNEVKVGQRMWLGHRRHSALCPAAADGNHPPGRRDVHRHRSACTGPPQ